MKSFRDYLKTNCVESILKANGNAYSSAEPETVTVIVMVSPRLTVFAEEDIFIDIDSAA